LSHCVSAGFACECVVLPGEVVAFLTGRSHVLLHVFRKRNDEMTYGARVAQSVKQLATSWAVRGSNPVGSEIFLTRPDRP
jgi:hypothetical protein